MQRDCAQNLFDIKHRYCNTVPHSKFLIREETGQISKKEYLYNFFFLKKRLHHKWPVISVRWSKYFFRPQISMIRTI